MGTNNETIIKLKLCDLKNCFKTITLMHPVPLPKAPFNKLPRDARCVLILFAHSDCTSQSTSLLAYVWNGGLGPGRDAPPTHRSHLLGEKNSYKYA